MVESFLKFRGNKLSRLKDLEKFRRRNFRGKGRNPRKRESFFQRKVSSFKVIGSSINTMKWKFRVSDKLHNHNSPNT